MKLARSYGLGFIKTCFLENVADDADLEFTVHRQFTVHRELR